MRTRTLTLAGVLAGAVGLVWFFQGIGVLPGSFMSGQPKWAYIGGTLAMAGALAVVVARRRR